MQPVLVCSLGNGDSSVKTKSGDLTHSRDRYSMGAMGAFVPLQNEMCHVRLKKMTFYNQHRLKMAGIAAYLYNIYLRHIEL